MVNFEETDQTLKTSDLADTCDLVAVMIYHEILLGATWKFVFMNACLQSEDLVGKTGNQLCIATLGRAEFTAKTIGEDTLDADVGAGGYIKDKLSPETVSISIGDIVYNATRISDVLQEDSTLGWVRASLQKMGESIAYKIECDIRDALVAGAGNVVTATTLGTLAYDDVVDAVALLKLAGYWGEDGDYLLFVNASQEADLVKDTRFTDTSRYSSANIPLQGELGKYASCRCFVTNIAMEWSGVAYALVVAPPTNQYGPACMFAWKRHVKQESWRDEQQGRDVFLLSTRYSVGCVFPDSIALISDC